MALHERSWPAPIGSAPYSHEAVCALLGARPALAALPPAVHTRLAMLARVRAFPDGAVLLREGEVADHAYLILRGTVRVDRARAPLGAGRDEVGPGAVLGMPSVLGDGDPQRASACAVGEVETLALSRLALALTLLQFPEAAESLRSAFIGDAS